MKDKKKEQPCDMNSSEFMIRILDLLNKFDKKVDIIHEILLLIKEFTKFEAVGIRVKEGEYYPYYETDTSPQDFIEAERYLHTLNNAGDTIRDSNGNAYLECMCGNIINGKIDASRPFFTKGGSFWSNCMADLFASATEKECRALNRFKDKGYESVAIIPLRSGSKTIGLLQFNDKRKEMFTLEIIEFFEKIGVGIGIALARKQMEEALKKVHDELEIQIKERTASLQHKVAEHRKVKEELVKLSTAIKQSPSAIVITDVKGNIEYVNPKFTKMTGYSTEEVMGKNCRFLKSGETSPEEYKQLWNIVTSCKEWWGEFHNKRKDGSLYWEDASISAVKNSKGVITHFIKVAEDITIRKQIEKEKEKLRQQLVLQGRLATLGELSSGLAHEIGNPLQTILGNTELLLMDSQSEELLSIKSATLHAKNIIENLLNFAKQRKTYFSKENINNILDRTFSLYGKQFKFKKINIVKNYSDLPKTRISPPHIEQVFLNLIANATKAMPNGGTLTVATRVVIASSPEWMEPAPYKSFQDFTLVCQPADQSGDQSCPDENRGTRNGKKKFIEISFKDTGVGIPKENINQLFEPFFTTGKEGTGLGLAVSYDIIKQHSGEISVFSEGMKKGTEFVVKLPVHT
ncbi:MAG: PAS domain S-box protein [Elusimicrobia bacterium]|nr:PAS domain S-box protein [Elusimicrobiota bacterium]